MALIEVHAATKDYWDGKTVVHALQGIDLAVEPGEFIAIEGPSGSGKTTLLNLVGGLDDVTYGQLILGGQDLATLRPNTLSQLRLYDIGFIFQAYNLIPVLNAEENVAFTMLLQEVPVHERKRRAIDMLQRVGLGDVIHRKPAALSGGQQQRVAVARAIVTHPKVVLADEPTANLDSETGARLLEMMKQLNEEEQKTFIFSTYDPMVMEYAQRLVLLKDGCIISDEKRAS